MMVTYQIPAPEPFDFFNTDDWPKWIRQFEIFQQSSKLSGKSEENQISTLIYSMGDATDDIYQSFRLTDEGECSYEDGSLRSILYVSRAMTECEQRYTQIEKEA